MLPVLEQELGPGVADALARTAEQLRADMELLDACAEAAAGRSEAPSGLRRRPAARGIPTPVRRRVLRLAALAAGAPASELFHDHVLAWTLVTTGTASGGSTSRATCGSRRGEVGFERPDPVDPV